MQLDLIQIDKGSIVISGRPVDASMRSAAIETHKPGG
jgi:hypothetical protein